MMSFDKLDYFQRELWLINTCISTYIPSDQQPQSLSEEIESGTLYSEVGQLLMSVGARHADCNTSPELARKDLNQEDIDTPFSGGFTLNLDDAESEGETEREEGGRGEGRENGVKMKPGHKRELMKIMSGYDLTGIVGIIPIFIQIIKHTCIYCAYYRTRPLEC